MKVGGHKQYRFGRFLVDPSEQCLFRDDVQIPLTGRAYETLLVLLERSGHLVEKADLFHRVWGDTFVEEGNLAVTISVIRKALGDDRDGNRFIETVAKRGYRFMAPVQVLETQPVPDVAHTTLPSSASPNNDPSLKRTWLLRVGVVPALVFFLVLVVIVMAAIAGKVQRAKADHLAEMNPEAAQLYLEGRYFFDKRNEDGLRRSIEYYERAVEKDSKYAPAYVGLADSYVQLGTFGMESAREAYPNAKSAIVKALELNRSLAEAHTSLGMVSFHYERNWTVAEDELQLAIKLNPKDVLAHIGYAEDLAATGRLDKAIEEARKAQGVDPISPSANTVLGRMYYFNRRYDDAISIFRHVLDLNPDFSRAHARLGMAYAASGDYGKAIREFQEGRQLSGRDPYMEGLIGYATALNGDRTSAQKLLDDLSNRSRREYVPAFSIALVSLGLGDRDAALKSLSQAYEDGSEYLEFASVDPLLDSLRSDERFVALLDRMRLKAIPTSAALRN